MQLKGAVQRTLERQRMLAYAAGVFLISTWTLLRFFTKRTIFDLVSQQVIAHQWLHGRISPAHMGQTAYVLKMLFLYVPLDLLPGPPRLKLILLTLVINAVTFVCIGLVVEKILREYRVRISWVFYAALVWLSTIAGSVFWIEFANSRNLEVAGGLLLLYLGIRYLRQPAGRLTWGIAALGTVLFFGDPLQVYMTATPLALYAGILTAAKKVPVRTGAALCGAMLLGYAVSRLLFAGIGHWLRLSFTDTGGAVAPHLSAAWLEQSIIGTAKSVTSLLGGANDAGRLREAANLGLLLAGCLGLAYSAVRQELPKRLALLGGCVCAVDSLVYIASGQAEQGATTSRYLIMIAPVLVLVLSAVRPPRQALRPAAAAVGAVLALNASSLVAATAIHWNTTFPADSHLASVYRYTQRRSGLHIYASTDTAMPILFLHNLPAGQALPVGCLNGNLVRTHFSMDQSFARAAATPAATAAIVLDGNTVTNTPNTCTAASISRQFGPPRSLDRTDDGSIVMEYPQSAIKLTD